MKKLTEFNERNERIKHRYFTYLSQADGKCEATVNAVAKSLDRFETHTGQRDFRSFHYRQAEAFKRHLAEQPNQRSGAPLSMSTQRATLGHLRKFIIWLADQPRFRSRITYSDAAYFSLSDKENRIATARRPTKGPTIEQVKHVLAWMPATTDIQRRNRALIAFALVTGARDSAIASFKLKHVDVPRRLVFQDAREVNTKNSKTFPTWFFPVGEDVIAIVAQWINYLRTTLLWGDDDPVFPATRSDPGQTRMIEAVRLARKHWVTTSPIRRVFREAFESADLPYFNPHSFRNTLTRYAQTMQLTHEEMKCWSQNCGHDDVMITIRSYGDVAPSRQEEVMRELATPKAHLNDFALLTKAVARELGLNEQGKIGLPS